MYSNASNRKLDTINDDIVLGIHHGHNASVAVIKNGKLMYAIQEERLVYEKNYTGWPEKSINRALNFLEIKPKDLKYIAFAGKRDFTKRVTKDEHIHSYKKRLGWIGNKRDILSNKIYTYIGPAITKLRRAKLLESANLSHCQIFSVDHHRCHAAAAYFGLRKSLDERYLVLTLDGEGDTKCAVMYIAEDGKLKSLTETNRAHSLGTIYQWVTFSLGFVPLEHEYKLMGMSPYVSSLHAEEVANIFHKYLEVDKDKCIFKKKIPEPLYRFSRRLTRDLQFVRFDSVCAGLQKFTEHLIQEWVKACIKKEGIRKLLCGGGVFMNVKANKCLAELSEVEFLDIYPSCGDDSNSIGAAFAVYANLFGHTKVKSIGEYYLGDGFTTNEAESFLAKTGLPYRYMENIELEVAKLLAKGHPVARVKGRMEFGARALCNRSILADPINQDVIRVLNRAVKKRDFWMPFAPVVLEENQNNYLKNPKNIPSSYMMLAFDTRENFREMIAAVHNADLTARPQILKRNDNPEMANILDEFEKITGRAVLLNTSYNLHGFPIVQGPKEALGVFIKSGLEYLALGNFLVSKNAK
jgi:carbamoyltransferase